MLLEWHNRNDGWGLLNIVICVVLFAILMGIALLFNSEGVAAVMIIVWFVLIGIVNFVINHYFAYLVKAGHVAVIAQTFKEGRVPDNCVPAVGLERLRGIRLGSDAGVDDQVCLYRQLDDGEDDARLYAGSSIHCYHL